MMKELHILNFQIFTNVQSLTKESLTQLQSMHIKLQNFQIYHHPLENIDKLLVKHQLQTKLTFWPTKKMEEDINGEPI